MDTFLLCFHCHWRCLCGYQFDLICFTFVFTGCACVDTIFLCFCHHRRCLCGYCFALLSLSLEVLMRIPLVSHVRSNSEDETKVVSVQSPPVTKKKQSLAPPVTTKSKAMKIEAKFYHYNHLWSQYN